MNLMEKNVKKLSLQIAYLTVELLSPFSVSKHETTKKD